MFDSVVTATPAQATVNMNVVAAKNEEKAMSA
jgi:hypothetical protein